MHERHQLNLIGARDNPPGEVSGFAPPGDIHRIRNTGPRTAISLHIYGTDITRIGSSARRAGWDAMVGKSRPWGGAWNGPIFVLTHHPEDATPADGVTFLSCDPAEAVRIALAAADGKNLGVFSPTIGAQLLELGLIDEIDIHIAPILLGDGIRLYDNPGSEPIRLHRLGDGDPASAVRVRYQPPTTARIATEAG